MYTKVATILTIIVVNVIILANVVVPHHHHDSEVCIAVAHCHSDDDVSGHNKESHRHDSEKSVPCGLNQIYVIPTDSFRNDYFTLPSSCDIFQLPAFMAKILRDETMETLLISRSVLPQNSIYLFYDLVLTRS